MNIGETLYVKNRNDWRYWLSKSHASAKEIWLIFYKKQTGKPSILYDDAVEEALCFGWIDSIVKSFDSESTVQRFSPRQKNSTLSEMNKERIRRLIEAGKMTSAGMESIKQHLEKSDEGPTYLKLKEFKISKDILKALKKDSIVWNNFENFPDHYKRIRIGFIEAARKRPDEFRKRLGYFIKMTSKNKRFGMIR